MSSTVYAPPAEFQTISPEFDAAAVDALRAREYARLDAAGHVYLDYTGAGLYAESQLREHYDLLQSSVLGNPHSTNPTSRQATAYAESARSSVLEFFNADPRDCAVIFTANASAALKIVGESYPFDSSTRLLLTADNHNSVNGIREYARARAAQVSYIGLETPDLRVDSAALSSALDRPLVRRRRGLLVYPAQSNMSGVQHSLTWIEHARSRGWDVLLDAAAFTPTNRLDLTRWRPDFVALSFYKLFGYPTGIGCLIARRQSLKRLRRPWFAGGTIDVVGVGAQGHHRVAGETHFEDGTINFLELPGVEIGLRHLAAIGMETLQRRVRALSGFLLDQLAALRHPDGTPMVRIYGPASTEERGGTVAFNILGPDATTLPYSLVEAAANRRRISLRTGCFCNPGAVEFALGLDPAQLQLLFVGGRRPRAEALRRRRESGAVRASVGIASTPGDIIQLVGLVRSLAMGRPAATL